MSPRTLADEWAGEMASYFYCEKERNVLPKAVTAGLLGVLEGTSSAADREEVFNRIEAYKTRSRRRIEHWLHVLDSKMALDMLAVKDALTSTTAGLYLSSAGFNRFQWMLAVAGGGHDQSPEGVGQYAKACGEWLAADQLVGRLSQVEPDLARGIGVNPWRESTRRTTAILVQFRWASELLATSFATEVQRDTTKYRGLQLVTPSAVRELFVWVDEYVTRQERIMKGNRPGPPPQVSTRLRPLIEALAVEGASYHGWPFDKLIATLDIEAYPFMKIGTELAPIALREATYSVELALFNLARRELGRDKDRSDLFESVAKLCLREVLPPDIEAPLEPAFCPVPGTSNAGETDFILRDAFGSTFIGECKSMAAVPAPGTVIHAFTNDVGKAVKQVKTRIKAVKDGCTVTVGGQTWDAPRGDVYGLVVPLHSYAGAVWNYDCLPESGADHRDIAVIPLHQLLLAARAMANGTELGTYIQFRQKLFDLRCDMHDELDILATFIFLGQRKIEDMLVGAPEYSSIVMRAYGAELDAMVSDTTPGSAKAWRRRLKRILI